MYIVLPLSLYLMHVHCAIKIDYNFFKHSSRNFYVRTWYVHIVFGKKKKYTYLYMRILFLSMFNQNYYQFFGSYFYETFKCICCILYKQMTFCSKGPSILTLRGDYCFFFSQNKLSQYFFLLNILFCQCQRQKFSFHQI